MGNQRKAVGGLLATDLQVQVLAAEFGNSGGLGNAAQA